MLFPHRPSHPLWLQSSSEAGTSHSCSTSSRSGSEAGSDGEEEHVAAGAHCRAGAPNPTGPTFRANGARTDHDRQRAQQRQRQQYPPGEGAANGTPPEEDAGPGPLRRHRARGRRHHWRVGRGRGSGSGSMGDEIPAGLVPEQLRRRSEVGSVLEPDGQSELDDGEPEVVADLAPVSESQPAPQH